MQLGGVAAEDVLRGALALVLRSIASKALDVNYASLLANASDRYHVSISRKWMVRLPAASNVNHASRKRAPCSRCAALKQTQRLLLLCCQLQGFRSVANSSSQGSGKAVLLQAAAARLLAALTSASNWKCFPAGEL